MGMVRLALTILGVSCPLAGKLSWKGVCALIPPTPIYSIICVLLFIKEIAVQPKGSLISLPICIAPLFSLDLISSLLTWRLTAVAHSGLFPLK
jgi:hypothetical protein